MQFQVPQFIDVEDKIVGPLTLKQFIYIASGIGLSLLLFFILKLWLWFVLSFFIMAIAAALAFVKINGRPLVKLAVSAIGFYWHPQTYVWQEEKQKGKKSELSSEKSGKNISLENIVSGMALRKSWQNLQTGSNAAVGHWGSKKGTDRYEIIRKMTGEKMAARRIDYR